VSGHVLIAGGSSGIGAACVAKFLAEGWRVTSVARRSQLGGNSRRFIGHQGDLREPHVAAAAVDAGEARLGPLTAVVQAVGDVPEAAELEFLDWDRWRATLDLCLGAAVCVTRASLPSLRRAGASGSMTFVSSVGGTKPYPGIADYCAAKAALSTLSKSVALELAPSRGRANSVSPAVVRTPIMDRAPFDEATAARWHKLGRIGEPEEIAKLIHFIASDAGSWITGQDVAIDGGMLL
jgi:NAD(P)-dependent dehydrogenase (short-subunit alcohol dehydrogenase family)